MTDTDILTAYDSMGGVSICYRAEGIFRPVSRDTMQEVIADWRRKHGSEKTADLISALASGHVVTSPTCPEFQYIASGDAGRQEQLFKEEAS